MQRSRIPFLTIAIVLSLATASPAQIGHEERGSHSSKDKRHPKDSDGPDWTRVLGKLLHHVGHKKGHRSHASRASAEARRTVPRPDPAPLRGAGELQHHSGSTYGHALDHSALGVQIEHNRPHPGSNVHHVGGGVYDGLRYGYFGYPENGSAPFLFAFYSSDPYGGSDVVASPWYGYSSLPPYVDNSRVTLAPEYRPLYVPGSDWQGYELSQRRERDLSHALDDVQDAFEHRDKPSAERLLPKSGPVAIFNDGKYDYSVDAANFREMFLDGVDGSKTVRYVVTEVRVRGDEAHVRARHEFTDSWGAEQSVVHAYTLRQEGGQFVIREFGTE